MKNLLIGNGVNIQFGGSRFSNKEIILRMLQYFDDEDFPKHIITDEPILAKSYMGCLFLGAKELLKGNLDNCANCSVEKKAIEEFKIKYGGRKSFKISDIGFEDYYLIHDLLFHKSKTANPEQFYVREALRMCFLASIYDKGKVNDVHQNFTDKFIHRLNEYDMIFSTNYDKNIELACNRKVFHLHGDFETRSEVYNPDSFRNKLSDSPIKDIDIDERYYYLYSSALSTHSGQYKHYYMTQNSLANSAIEKMAKGYAENTKIKQEVDNWLNDKNALVKNLAESIQLKVINPNLKYNELYPIDELKHMEGNLDIIGLSPYNDYHLFDEINNNTHLSEIVFYYFETKECEIIEKVLEKKNIKFEMVSDLWEELK